MKTGWWGAVRRQRLVRSCESNCHLASTRRCRAVPVHLRTRLPALLLDGGAPPTPALSAQGSCAACAPLQVLGRTCRDARERICVMRTDAHAFDCSFVQN
eukprot:1391521-Pleurochrysis_carterae.AAC.1